MIENYQLDLRLADDPEVLPGIKPIHPVGAAIFFQSNHSSDVIAYIDTSADKSSWSNVDSGTVVAKGWLYKFLQTSAKYIRIRLAADAADGIRVAICQPAGAPMYQDLLNAS